MSHDAVIARKTLKNKTIRRDMQTCIMGGISLAPNQGELPSGLLISERADGEGVPFRNLTQVLATGDGSAKVYSGIIDNFPLEPGTVEITDGTETFHDDGYGRLHGSAGGSGTVIYSTGEYDISFNANVAAVNITSIAKNKFVCVLDQDVDTALSTAGVAVYHGPVKAKELLKGAAFDEEADASDMKIMRKTHIFPG